MSDVKRRGTLPTGVPPASSVPSYLTHTSNLSSAHESTGSNESFMSQVVQPFHVTGDTDVPEETSYRVFRSKTVSPELLAGRSNGHAHSSSSTTTKLDPGVRSYIAGSSPLVADAPVFEPRQRVQDGGMTTDNGGYTPEQHTQQYVQGRGPSNVMSPQQHGATGYQPGSYAAAAAQYPQGGYGQGAVNNINAGFTPSGTSPQYGDRFMPPASGVYTHFGAGPNTSYPKVQPPMNQGNFGQPSYGSPMGQIVEYGGANTANQSFQGQTYNNHGDGRGGGFAGGQGYARPGYTVPYVQSQQYGNTERYQPSGQNHNGGMSFAERSRQEHGPRNGNGYHAQRLGHGDEYSNHAVQSPQHVQHSSNFGNGQGSMRLNTDPRPQPRHELGVQNSRQENRGLPRHTPVRVSEVRDKVNISSSRPTQGREDFTSGQLMTAPQQPRSLNRPPHSPERMSSWLDNVPAVTSPEVINTPRSPPKPLGFALAAVPGGDPFTTPSNKMFSNPATNPFGTHITPLIPVRNDAAHAFENASPQLRRLTNSGTRMPTVEEALDMANLPFVEYCRAESTGPDNFGVIKIRNIPYGVNRQEIMAFMGRNARLVAEFDHEPIHIVMERVTSKTLDCYVEFINLNEAISAVSRFETNKNGGRSGRLGQRHVEIELSSQEALMKDLFPKAKNTKWTNGRPHITPRDPNDPYNSGFQGFVSKEELVMLVKHVEAPQRSPFSKDCPQRPFECLISTLLKYPWYMVDYITIEDRNLLHETTKTLMTMLYYHVQSNREDTRLTAALLKRAWRAVLACPGLTPTMKDDIMVICNIDNDYAVEFGLAPMASEWRFLWTIGPKRGVPVDVLMYYINLIKNITTQQRQQLSLAEQAARGRGAVHDPTKLFGELDQQIVYPPDLRRRTLAQVAAVEWVAIENALRRALTLALPAPR